MEEKVKKSIFYGILTALVFIVLFFYFPKMTASGSEDTVKKIEVWDYCGENDSKKPFLLPERWDDSVGNSIKIETELSGDFEEKQEICFWTRAQDVTVSLDGEEIYSTKEAERFGQAVISMWNRVDVPAGSAGSKLAIVFHTPYENYSYALEEVVYGSKEAVKAWTNDEYGIDRTVDAVLIVTGIVFMALAGFSRHDKRYNLCQFFFGLMTFLFGVWMQTSTKDNAFCWMDGYWCALVSYLAFYMIPVVLLLYVRLRVLRIKRYVRISEVFLFITGIFVPIAFLMQAFGICDLYEMHQIGAFFLFVTAAWALFVAMYYYIKERQRISILTVANGIIYILVVASIILQENSLENLSLRFDLTIRVGVMLIISFEYYMLFAHFRQKDEKQEAIELQNQKMKLQIVTSQISPHFILNTLGAIRSLIRIDSEKAYDVLYDFSKYIRKNIEEKDYDKKIPFLEELDYIDTYLSLEKVRYGDKVKIVKEFQTTQFWVLPLTIQPFVENAVKHGLMGSKKGGTIWIRTYEKEKNTYVEIEDNGVGFDVEKLEKDIDKSKSVGLKSAMYRLRYKMSGKCIINSSMNAGENGTKVIIELPIE